MCWTFRASQRAIKKKKGKRKKKKRIVTSCCENPRVSPWFVINAKKCLAPFSGAYLLRAVSRPARRFEIQAFANGGAREKTLRPRKIETIVVIAGSERGGTPLRDQTMVSRSSRKYENKYRFRATFAHRGDFASLTQQIRESFSTFLLNLFAGDKISSGTRDHAFFLCFEWWLSRGCFISRALLSLFDIL